MFSAFGSLGSLQLPIPQFLRGAPVRAININPVDVHDVESRPGKRARTLKHLLKLNHASHSIIYHDLQFTNHMPHVGVSPPLPAW
jgi:hypothetical protein